MKEDKYYEILTLGCQMNERDSESLAGMLEQEGYSEVTDGKLPDLAIINTCSVRDHADKRFFGILGQYKKYKRTKPDFIMCVCGCMMQQDHIVSDLKSKFPWVDIVFGTHNIEDFPDLLAKFKSDREPLVEILDEGKSIPEGLPAKRKFDYKAFVNIMLGCNNFCSYCIVPYTRGRERSRQAENIEKECRHLVEAGTKEITLLGQNVNSYRDGGGEDFPNLLRRLARIEGLKRIRFMTSHPKDLSDDLIAAFAELDNLCKHIHLPVQSGSNRILKLMNRRYSAESYLETVHKLKEACPEIAITTDIIVGFPGESEQDFQKTLDIVDRVGYDSAFTFIYSIRKGTPAGRYGDQVDQEVKGERLQRLIKAVEETSERRHATRLGKVETVLVEGEVKRAKERLMTGRSDHNKLVEFKGSKDLVGELVSVKILDTFRHRLEGELLP